MCKIVECVVKSDNHGGGNCFLFFFNLGDYSAKSKLSYYSIEDLEMFSALCTYFLLLLN